MSVAVRALSFLLGMASIFFIFMKLSDRVNQRLLFGLSAITQVIGMSLLAIFPLTLPIALIHVFLMAVGGGFGALRRVLGQCVEGIEFFVQLRDQGFFLFPARFQFFAPGGQGGFLGVDR